MRKPMSCFARMARLTTCVATVLAMAAPAFSVDIPPSSKVGPVPGSPGAGLNGRYWELGRLEMSPTDDALKNIGAGIIASRPETATFLATVIDYTGDDLTTLTDWLQADGASVVGPPNEPMDFNDGMISLTGFMAIDAAGAKDFYMPSDDGSILTIGGVTVIDNDGGHGQPGPNPGGQATFAEAGLYPVELSYFNGNWTNDAGDHGGANLRLFAGTDDTGPIIPTETLYTVPEPTTLALAGLALAALVTIVRRKK